MNKIDTKAFIVNIQETKRLSEIIDTFYYSEKSDNFTNAFHGYERDLGSDYRFKIDDIFKELLNCRLKAKKPIFLSKELESISFEYVVGDITVFSLMRSFMKATKELFNQLKKNDIRINKLRSLMLTGKNTFVVVYT